MPWPNPIRLCYVRGFPNTSNCFQAGGVRRVPGCFGRLALVLVERRSSLWGALNNRRVGGTGVGGTDGNVVVAVAESMPLLAYQQAALSAGRRLTWNNWS